MEGEKVLPVPFFDLGLVDVLDVVFVAVLLYAGIVVLRTARAGLVLAGMAILLATYLVTRQFGMQLTAWLFQGFFAVFVVIVVVVFQAELRQVFERIAVMGLRRRRAPRSSDSVADTLVRVVTHLAYNRIGALFVLPGHDPVERHVEGGVPLGGFLSEPLLLSLFDPHSTGHDGAALLKGNRVERFAVQLPLSKNFAELGRRGTRHSAALGLAERTDALCVVVSEEHGTVSIAREGTLRQLLRPDLVGPELKTFFAALSPRRSRREVLVRLLRERWREKALAAGLATALWVAFVPGAQQVERHFDIPVSVENLSAGLAIEKVDPESVRVVLGGYRRGFFLLDENRLAVRLDASQVERGLSSFELTNESVRHPGNVSVTSVEPRRVRLRVKRIGADARGAEGGSARPARAR